MTVRAVVLGILLALTIASATYFNDWVIGQTNLVGNHLPISVFGIAVLLLLCINPLLRFFGPKSTFKASEVAVIVALGLSVCGWPGSSFFRGFTTVTAYPAHWLKTKANWQSTKVMSYVPGASKELAPGQVRDWKRLATMLEQGRDDPTPNPVKQVYRLLPEAAQHSLHEGMIKGFDAARVWELTDAINRVLESPELYDPTAFAGVRLAPRAVELLRHTGTGLAGEKRVELNRWLIVSAFDNLVQPPPTGEGLLFDHGRADPFALDTLVQGRGKNQQLAVSQLPWRAWWPSIRLWWGVGLLLALAALCMALIVHPQWSKRELLPYPVARFIEEISARSPLARLPNVAKSNLFWLGFVAMVVLHLINGIHAWIPDVPEIPRKYEFWAMAQLFPNASRVYGSYGYFAPTIFASVVAFAFFLSSSVSFSLGIAELLYMALAGTLLGYGIQIDGGYIRGTGSAMLRFGSFLAVFVMIVYTGRHYFARVGRSTVRAAPSGEVPVYVVWAARVGVIAIVLTIGMLRMAGVAWGFAAAFVAIEVIIFVVMSRMIAETGTFFMKPEWAPVGVLTGLLGFDAIGPSTYVALALATALLSADLREVFMPYLVNGLKMVDRDDGPTPSRVAPFMLLVIVMGLIVAGVTTLTLQYNHGAAQVGNSFATDQLPLYAFDGLAQHVASASADGTLAASTFVDGWARFSAVKPEDGAIPWLLLGLTIGFGAAVARLRWSFWPLHPVAFLVWSTYPIAMFGPSFLLGWMIKGAVVGTSGAHGYHQVKPLMVGVIAGEMVAGLGWMLYGAAYYFVSGQAPVAYSIFPT
jgi:hypothetical protein